MPFDLKSLDGSLWLMEPRRLRQTIAEVHAIPTCLSARAIVEERHRRLDVARQVASVSIRAQRGKIGVLPIWGPVGQRYDRALSKTGGTALDEVSMGLKALLAAPDVSAVLLHIDSPGGSSFGVEELSDEIFAARAKKPIYAISDSLMASAAYWIGSAASNVSCTPGGDVGSVGVYAVHVDESKAMEDDGFKMTFVQAGKYKTEFASTAPLSDDARGYLQEQVDGTYAKFVQAVARNRGVSVADVKAKYGQGRCLNADDALTAGMIDGIRPFDQLMDRLTGGGPATSSRAASAQILRLRQEQRRRLIGSY